MGFVSLLLRCVFCCSCLLARVRAVFKLEEQGTAARQQRGK